MHLKSVGFKTLTITCLALALISTISLNIIRTYSINNTRTNALGNTTSGITTQSASDGNALASPASISLKLSPVTTNTTSNPDNGSAIVSLNIPADGGVAVGGHSVEVTTNSAAGYKVTMSLDNGYGSTDLVNTDLPSQAIPSLPEPTSDTLTPLENKTWGIALLVYPFSSIFSGDEIYSSADQAVLSQAKFIAPGYILRFLDYADWFFEQPTGPNHDGTAADNLGNIYYGVRVDDPSTFTAGQYTTSIIYTAIANIPPAPELTKLVLNDSVQQNQASEFAIEGTNLDAVYSIKLCPTGQQPDTTNTNCYEVPSKDIDTYLDDTTTSTKGTVLSFTNPAISEPGTYDVYAVSQGGTSKPLTDAFIVQEESICRNGDPNSDCQVDIDDNMIPIAYNEDEDSWQIVTKSEIESTSGSWYDYTNKQWANAVTLRDDYEAGAVCVSVNLTPPEGFMFSVRDIHSADYNDISKIIRPETLNPEDDFGMMGFRGDTRILDVVVSLDGSCATNRETLRYTPLAYARMAKAGMTLGEGINGNTYQVNFNGSQYDDLFNNSILGYWVYIPRYAYEVQRPNAIDRVVTDEYPLPDNVNTTGDNYSPYNSHSIRNEFSIHFEKATDTKKTPAETCNTLNITNPNQMWANSAPTHIAGPDNTNILAKDYRTGCAAPGNTNNISRLYADATTQTGTNTVANNTTWATHPAFTFGSTELNGLWVGKFETTGTVTNPTVKPNQHANVSEYIGEFYTMAKHIGVYDSNNTGGNDITANGTTLNATGQWTSLHNLSTATSHMLKNSEWGAIAYLASSKYGAGTNNVSNNNARPSISADADGDDADWGGITGCGPNNIDRSTTAYSSVITSTGETVNLPELSSSHIEDPLACGDVEHSYIGKIGQLASTTNNVYGIYDMSGGVYDYAMGNLTSSDTETTPNTTGTMQNQAKPPYVDLYKESLGFDSTGSDDANPTWSYSANAEYYNNDICIWGTCGGHALHETKHYQSTSYNNQSWGDDSSSFVYSNRRWCARGAYAWSSSFAGLFSSVYGDGGTYDYYGFRSVLLAAL